MEIAKQFPYINKNNLDSIFKIQKILNMNSNNFY